ncbi:Hypothetical predicted protein [Pelobates cultripes]|uniref:Uncharacterized protein n=1 Tax=Pelobates cultripes TaxID=61616 RepID=A0AAD1VIT3_PELCU|nr:Hypothetical predicted protein [Pelobates cultripes]
MPPRWPHCQKPSVPYRGHSAGHPGRFIKRISLHDGVRKGHRKLLTQGLHSIRDYPLDVDDTRTQMFPRDERRVTAWKVEKTKFPLGMDRYDL